MTGRPGFFRGLLQGDASERDADDGLGSGAAADSLPAVRLGEPDGQPSETASGTPPGFDPVWGTLGAPPSEGDDSWLARGQEEVEGVVVDVEVFGNGFQICGQIRTGQFDRLSDWLNMQTGFIQVRDAWSVHLGQTDAPDPNGRKGTLWARVNQIVMMAERSAVQRDRPGAPVVEKQRREVSIVTPGYELRGRIHVHANGSMSQFLESPDPHFLPVTDLTVHWLADAALVAHFSFAMVNREQLVTVLDESTSPAGDSADPQVPPT